MIIDKNILDKNTNFHIHLKISLSFKYPWIFNKILNDNKNSQIKLYLVFQNNFRIKKNETIDMYQTSCPKLGFEIR